MLTSICSARNSFTEVAVEMDMATLVDSLTGFTNLNTFLRYDPAITPLGFYPKVLKIPVLTKTHTQMFIVVLSIFSKT